MKLDKGYYHYLIAKLCDAPLWAMIAYLPFILAKELSASQFQITLAITVKPLVALGSFYLGAWMSSASSHLSRHILWSSFLGRLPFILFPFVQNVWFYLFGFAIYSLMDRAIIPPWMELLKGKLGSVTHVKAVSDGALIRFLMPIVLAVSLAVWMDAQEVWRWLFAGASLISFVGLIPLANDRRFTEGTLSHPQKTPGPWKSFLFVLKTRPDFAFFQGIFFLGGMGIMMYQPLLPRYCVDIMHMDYKELSLSLGVCKGIGFACTSRIWSRGLARYSLFVLAAVVAFFSSLTPLLMGCGGGGVTLFCIAFLVYGIMQAGSEPIWHVSGPKFSGQVNSGPYTSMNVLSVGVRGLFAPALGALLGQAMGLQGALWTCCAVSFCGGLWGLVGYKLFPSSLSSPQAQWPTNRSS